MDTNALFKISYGLYLLCTNYDGKDNGCIINTAVQVANNPVKISVSLSKGTLTNELIEKSGKFNVSVITKEAEYNLFEHFGMQTGRETDKFSSMKELARSKNGVYYLTKWANAFVSVKVTQVIDLGSHNLFIGEMEDGKVLSDESSCTYEYYHSDIKVLNEDKNASGWRCKICGYVYEGKELPEDYVCPLCNHPAADFEKI